VNAAAPPAPAFTCGHAPIDSLPHPARDEVAITEVGALPSDVDETRLLSALRAGDEEAFATLVARYHGSLKEVARTFGASDAVAEEIVQETWMAALEGFDRFEQRSSLKAWIFGILKHQARRRASRERRSIPFSSVGLDDVDGPVVDPARFQGDDGCWPGHWATPPRPWDDPQRRLASLEAREQIRAAIAGLPPRQRAILALRDVEGLAAEEVCALLEISEGNQRVLLHRARTAVRNALEGQIDG
jgi:RNA polymerase sigma-70 factor, ECF subfamily